jgi:hypothetical protein
MAPRALRESTTWGHDDLNEETPTPTPTHRPSTRPLPVRFRPLGVGGAILTQPSTATERLGCGVKLVGEKWYV